MLCVSFRVLSPRPLLSSTSGVQTSAGANDNTRSRRSTSTRSRHGRRVLSRRSNATSTASTSTGDTVAAPDEGSDDQPLTEPPSPTRRGQNRSFGRCFVLTWKRMNKSPRPRKSQRFSFIPPGFVLVSHPRDKARDQNQDDVTVGEKQV